MLSSRKLLNKIFIKFGNNGKKRLFLVIGIFNMFLTNISLQILLFLVSTLLATVISQIFNFLIGYYFYGKKVFKVNKLNKFFFKKYLLLALTLWMLNFGLIQSFFYLIRVYTNKLEYFSLTINTFFSFIFLLLSE